MQLKDVKGNTFQLLPDGTFRVKTPDYVARYPYTVVDNPIERDWAWQVALDKKGYPVIAMGTYQ